MKKLGGCEIYGPNDYSEHHVGSEDSSCFYFAPFNLSPLVESLKAAGAGIACRAARIEVTDKLDALHAHEGLTVVFIAAGSGIFKTKEGDIAVRAGDWVVVPPNTPHLSIADPHTVMPEMLVYIGAANDRQASVSVAA